MYMQQDDYALLWWILHANRGTRSMSILSNAAHGWTIVLAAGPLNKGAGLSTPPPPQVDYRARSCPPPSARRSTSRTPSSVSLSDSESDWGSAGERRTHCRHSSLLIPHVLAAIIAKLDEFTMNLGESTP